MAYHVKTTEGRKLQFTPNKKGLHVLNYKSCFKVRNGGCVFGKTVGSPIVKEV